MSTCYCCNNQLRKNNTEFHHFPNPKRLEGSTVVPLCAVCHNLIDRFNLEDWPIDMLNAAKNTWNGVPSVWRLVILKVLSKLNESKIINESEFISQ